MKSNTLHIYKTWLATATEEQVQKVDEIYAACEEHYAQGGDVVVECMEPSEVLEQFKTVKDAKEYCNLHLEQATNCRWGEDSDPELQRERWV